MHKPNKNYSNALYVILRNGFSEKNGIQLLYSLMWPWQKVSGKMKLFYESALHKALALDNGSGPKVSGNTQRIDDWPPSFQKSLVKLFK